MADMSAFTPGPLQATFIGKADDGENICIVATAKNPFSPIADYVMEGDAVLFAAAPDMYEALQLASNVLFLLDDKVKALGLRAGNVREKISAALARAAA
jgi:hypothetical protein